MEQEELEKCLKDMQEAVSSLDERNASAFRLNTEAKVNGEECLAEVKDLNKDVNTLSALIKESKSIEQTRQLLAQMENITGNLQLYNESLKDTLKRFPSRIKTEVSLRFQGRNRTIFIVLASAVLITFFSVWLCLSTWQRNRQLKENDLKYRYLVLRMPASTFQVDTLYRNNPRQFKTTIEQMEDYQKVQQRAETIADEKEKEARAARQKIEQLKKHPYK